MSVNTINPLAILVDLKQQKLILHDSGKLLSAYRISSGLNGVGEEKNSGKTPRGWHIIRAKIGQAAPPNTVFVGRRRTGEQYTAALKQQYPKRDWILTRILWLSGLEVGMNRLGNVDTMQRYIYIHGTPDSTRLGRPGSRGCIRMRNSDIIELFDRVPCGTKVYIGDASS